MDAQNEEPKTEVVKTQWMRPMNAGEILLRDALEKSKTPVVIPQPRVFLS